MAASAAGGSSKNSITSGRLTLIRSMSSAWTTPSEPNPATPLKTVTPFTARRSCKIDRIPASTLCAVRDPFR